MIGNLLALAQSVIGVQPVTWRKFLSRNENAAGYEVAVYDDAKPIEATVQPVPRKMYDTLGLDYNREYVTLYTPAGVVCVSRDGSGDKVIHDGKTYVCESGTDWKAQAGWVSIVAIKVPA